MIDKEFRKLATKIVSKAYGADCVEQFFVEYSEPKDVVRWAEQELYFYNTYGFEQFEMKNYSKKEWQENVKELKSFLKKYKEK